MNELLREGDVILLEKGHKVYADVPEYCVYDNRKDSLKLVHALIKINDALDYFEGEYIVYNTSSSGGGSNFDGGYPHGRHVLCAKIDSDIKIDFYQTGCFTAMIKDIKPIRRAKLTWVVSDEH